MSMRAFLLQLVLLTPSAWAAENSTSAAVVDPVSAGYLVKITFGLAFIIVLIFALAWLMKKLQLTPQSSQSLIRVVSAISVGHRDRIALVEVGNEQILIGLTPGRIERLHTMQTPVQYVDQAQIASAGFQDKLNRLMQRSVTGNKKEAQ